MMLPFVLAAMIAADDPSCNRGPRATHFASMDYPEGTELLGPGLLEVLVKVTLDETGKATKEELIESSGYDAFDNVAMRVAKNSTYEPAEVACSPAPSVFVFRATFENKYINDNGEITPPTFTFPDGWNAPSATTPLPDGMQTVAEYTRGDERVIIAAEHVSGGDLDGNAAVDKMIAALHLHPVGMQSGPIAICSGFQSGWSAIFSYADGAQERGAQIIEVQGANGRFSLFYSTPKGILIDEAIDKAIEGFCVQGAPRATPHNVGMPVG